MIRLHLHPPSFFIPCQTPAQCAPGCPGRAVSLSGKSCFAPVPQAALWAPTGFRRGRAGMVPVVGEA